MTPEQMSEMLREWARACPASYTRRRRVDCVEPEGPRRTWVLWEGGRQCGHVRMRLASMWATPVGSTYSVDLAWTVEASDWARRLLGLDDASKSGQTDPHG